MHAQSCSHREKRTEIKFNKSSDLSTLCKIKIPSNASLIKSQVFLMSVFTTSFTQETLLLVALFNVPLDHGWAKCGQYTSALSCFHITKVFHVLKVGVMSMRLVCGTETPERRLLFFYKPPNWLPVMLTSSNSYVVPTICRRPLCFQGRKFALVCWV